MVQFFPLLCCNLSVFAFSDPVQSQIHDPDPFQLLYLISQIPAHSADLPVQSLCQNDPKAAFSCLHHSAWSGHCIKNRDSLAHPSDKFPVHRLIHCHKIFFLMIVSGAHDLTRVLELANHFKIPAAVCVNKWDINPGMTEIIVSRTFFFIAQNLIRFPDFLKFSLSVFVVFI